MLAFIVGILSLVEVCTAVALHNVSRSQFDSIIAKSDIALVALVSSWTELEAEWTLAAAQTKQSFITIDCEVEPSLCIEYDIASLPAIRLFKGHKSAGRYRGPRKAPEIVSYIQRLTLPIVSLLDASTIGSFKSTDEHVCIAYISPADAHLKSMFEGLAARNHHRFSFGLVTDIKIANSEKIDLPSIVCHKKIHGDQEIFSGEWRVKALDHFLETATEPLIGELSRRNELKYLQSGKSLLYIFAETPRERAEGASILKPLAAKYKEYISFVTIDALEYAQMAPVLGLKKGIFPALALQNPMFGQVFPFEQGRAISVENVEQWVLDIVGGKVNPWGGEMTEGEARRRDEL